ncbi:MAG TPA: hypothetical protein VHO70_04910 [Chitinispirillaceae bacterium]|nr:hypothetical protein [Chitinispirillaceae bacterium]
MKKITLALLLLPLFFYCQTAVSFNEIPADFVYNIKQHGDSIYYATNSGEIFRFHLENADEPVSVGVKKNHPIRSLLFINDNTLLACSYRSGLYKVVNDTLDTRPEWYHPAWSMKAGTNGTIWLAGRNGIYKQSGDTFELFSECREAFDLAFYKNELVVGHYKGISFYDMDSGHLIRTLCKDTVCWMTTVIDTTLICGGVECCVIISGDSIRTVKLEPKNNIPWACAADSSHSLMLATEKGLFQIRNDDEKASCIGYYKRCIKSVFIDSRGTLWVGRYFK